MRPSFYDELLNFANYKYVLHVMINIVLRKYYFSRIITFSHFFESSIRKKTRQFLKPVKMKNIVKSFQNKNPVNLILKKKK